MTVEIPLTQGQVAIVCDCHAHLVENHKWRAIWNIYTRSYYAVRDSPRIFGKRKNIQMHRVINGTPDGIRTDHENHNTLDNRCVNLRDATTSQNMMNRGKQANNTSGYKGISQRKDNGKWMAQIQLNGKKKHLGQFDDIEQAKQARDDAEREMFGEFAMSD